MTSSWDQYSNRFKTMPSKHNESRRHKKVKSRYKVTSWHDYNTGLRQRGNVMFWFGISGIATEKIGEFNSEVQS